ARGVRAGRHGLRQRGLVPAARPAEVELDAADEGPGRTHRDAIAAVDARRVGQRRLVFCRDPGAEAAAGDADRKRVLPLGPARLAPLVAAGALRVVPDV